MYIVTVPDLRKQIIFHQCLRREDITGISSFTFNEWGEAVYQISSSELQRISISTSGAVFPRCSIDGKIDESSKPRTTESNHVARPATSPTSSSNVQIEDGSTESGDNPDITIDSVRDHTNSSPVPPPAVSSTT